MTPEPVKPSATSAREPVDEQALDELQGHARQLVERRILPGLACSLIVGGGEPRRFSVGLADIEATRPFDAHTIVRAFSNTKLATSCAALRLVQRGILALDEPIARWLPEFTSPRVLRPGARTLDDAVPARHPITVRHLFAHMAGFSHGVFDPGTLLYQAYHERGVRRPDTTLAELMGILADLPLNFEPGTAWDYSAATDVLARLVEVATGQRFGDALAAEVFVPLGMRDTGFVLTSEQRGRFAALYGALDPVGDPDGPGLQRLEDVPYPGAWERAFPRQSGAGGLFTTLADWERLVQALIPARAGGTGPRLLDDGTLAAMAVNQLPDGVRVQFAHLGRFEHLGHGLVGAVTLQPDPAPSASPAGQLQWGGLAGTHWCLHPGTGRALVLMTQRHLAFWHPFWWAFRRRAMAVLAGAGESLAGDLAASSQQTREGSGAVRRGAGSGPA